MENRNSNSSHSPFYDLSESESKKRSSYEGELQIFSESLKRTSEADTHQQTTNHLRHSSAPAPRIKKRKSKYRNRTMENRSITLTVVMIYAVVGFFVASLMIARYSNIIKTDEKLDAVEAQIDEMKSQAEELRLQVSLQDDIAMVQDQAKNRLGMDYPSNDQIVYVNLDGDNVEDNTDAEVMQSDSTVQ
jgi:cell division protein FtsB